jgi:hypothetical protein
LIAAFEAEREQALDAAGFKAGAVAGDARRAGRAGGPFMERPSPLGKTDIMVLSRPVR